LRQAILAEIAMFFLMASYKKLRTCSDEVFSINLHCRKESKASGAQFFVRVEAAG